MTASPAWVTVPNVIHRGYWRPRVPLRRAGLSTVSQQPRRSNEPSTPAEALGGETLPVLRLDVALERYRSRFASGHGASLKEIEAAVCAVVDEMKADDKGPVEVLLAIKGQLAAHPASATVHSAAVHWCIERYYLPKRDERSS